MPGSIGGIDEVGRGCIVGPLIFCMVSSPSPTEMAKALRALGVTDSKTIKNPTKMHSLSNQIKKLMDVYFEEAEPQEIDLFVYQNQLTLLSMTLVRRLLSRAPWGSTVTVDAIGNIDTQQGALAKDFPGLEVKVFHKAETMCPFVAAASICAKDLRNGYLERINQEYPLGSGYPADPVTRRFLLDNRERLAKKEFLFIRYSWKTLEGL